MINCDQCILHKQSRKGLEFANFTEGIGNKEAEVMIIFDSPFLSDMSSGTFFSDTTMRDLLNTFLKQIGLTLEEVYVTCLMKCYMSDPKKKPTKPQKEKCFELHLKKELEEIKPKVVLLCGTTVSKYMVEGIVNMKQAVGNYFYSNIYKCYCLPLFNFYYLSKLSSQSPQHKQMFSAFAKARYLLDKHKEDKYDIKVSSDYSLLSKMDKVISIDLETTGLSHSTDKILTVGLSDLKTNLVFDLKEIDWKRIYPELLKRKLIAHNANFEIKFMKAAGYSIEDNIVGDTMLMQFLLNPDGALSLGFLTQLYFGFAYKDVVDRADMISMEPEVRKLYCGTDTFFTVRLFYKLMKMIKERGSYESYKVFMRLERVLANLEYRGIKVDLEKIKEIMIEYSDTKDKHEQKFKKKFKLPEDFNMNSPKQLKKLIYEDLKLPVTTLTKTKQPSTKAEVIEKLGKKYPVLKTLIDYRTFKGHIEKLVGYNEATQADGRIHSEFWMYSPSSSRVMCNKPNYQNVPRDSRIKEIFVASEGHTFVYYDYSSLEFRVWIELAKDLKGIEFVNSGKDIHYFIASRFLRKPESEITKDERNKIKSCVYGSLYGSTPEGVAMVHDVPVKEAEQIQRIFFNICKKGYFWMKGLENQINRDKFLKTPFGTYKFFPDIDMAHGKKKEEMIRSGKNFIVQSWGAELVFIGMYKVYKALQEHKLDSGFVHQIHDAGIIECQDKDVEEVTQIVKDNAISPYKMSIPLGIEIKVGKSWADLKSIGKFEK